MAEKDSLIELFRKTVDFLLTTKSLFTMTVEVHLRHVHGGFFNMLVLKTRILSLKVLKQSKKREFLLMRNTPNPKRFSVSPVWDEMIYAPRQFVEETVSGKTESILLDARSAERYRGETEPIDPIAGRIPGAFNFDWEQLKKDGLFNMDESVKVAMETVVDPSKEVTVYCGSGVTAAPLYAMLAREWL